MDSFSWLAVIIGAMAFFFLGAAWYTFLFRKPWAADMGFADALPDRPQTPPAYTLIGSFVTALVVSGVIEWLVRDGEQSWGLKVGALVGLAVAAVMGQNALYDPRPARLWLINAGYPLVGCIVVGSICSAIG